MIQYLVRNENKIPEEFQRRPTMNQWRVVNRWGSLQSADPMDPTAGFHAGRLNDVLRLNFPHDSPILVQDQNTGGQGQNRGSWFLRSPAGPDRSGAQRDRTAPRLEYRIRKIAREGRSPAA